ncbi:MAG TPA: DUF2934 domain-containing protein [Candidatus Baltobacteraceae bacterium]|nr:DUF2934 domain-containing protein [Candidatus Baltobacteraceae bacterium]
MTDIRDLERAKQHLPTHEEIEQRAHEIYMRRGGGHGQEMDDWLKAETELRNERQAAAEASGESASTKSRTATAGTSAGFTSGAGSAKR